MDRSASLGDGRDTRENKRKLSAIVNTVRLSYIQFETSFEMTV
jgi:hypothetical protein